MAADICLNYRRNLAVAAFLCGLAYSSVAVAQTLEGINAVSITLLGVPLTSLFMSAVGTLIGFIHIKPLSSRRRLYFGIAGHTVLAAWLTALVPRWQKWDVPPELIPPMAGLFAVCSVIFVPVVVEHGPEVLRSFLGRFFGHNATPREGD